MPFGLSVDEFMQYASDKGMRRFGTISSTRGRLVGEIDLDYSPLQLEDTFAEEDEKALAAVSGLADARRLLDLRVAAVVPGG